MDDLISRQAAISEIMEDLEDRSLHDDPATPEDYAEGYDEGIRNAAAIVLQMPSAQPGWIPCKTRKPEKSGQYLVTKQQKTGEIQLATAHYNTAFDEWSGNGNFKKVLAWQPLPSPWKGGQE